MHPATTLKEEESAETGQSESLTAAVRNAASEDQTNAVFMPAPNVYGSKLPNGDPPLDMLWGTEVE